jgi:hypothetical protein
MKSDSTCFAIYRLTQGRKEYWQNYMDKRYAHLAATILQRSEVGKDAWFVIEEVNPSEIEAE